MMVSPEQIHYTQPSFSHELLFSADTLYVILPRPAPVAGTFRRAGPVVDCCYFLFFSASFNFKPISPSS